MRKPHVNLQTPQFYFMKVLLGPISWQIHFPWLVQTSEQEARKKEGGVEQLVNMGVKKGVFLSGCLNRLLTDGPIRGCCVVPAAAVSSVPQCPRQIFNPHTARYGSFAKIFFSHFLHIIYVHWKQFSSSIQHQMYVKFAFSYEFACMFSHTWNQHELMFA